MSGSVAVSTHWTKYASTAVNSNHLPVLPFGALHFSTLYVLVKSRFKLFSREFPIASQALTMHFLLLFPPFDFEIGSHAADSATRYSSICRRWFVSFLIGES